METRGLVTTMPWFGSFSSFMACVPEPTASELLNHSEVASLSKNQQELIELAFWLGVGSQNPVARLRNASATALHRICKLINSVADQAPELISGAGVWNAPGVIRTAGTMAERLLWQDAGLPLALLTPKAQGLLLAPCGATITQGVVVRSSMAQIAYVNGLYQGARWAMGNDEFAENFAYGMNTGVNMSRLLKACVTLGRSGDCARELLSVMARDHQAQLKDKFNSQKQLPHLSGTMINLMKFWRSALGKSQASSEIPAVVENACKFTGNNYQHTLRLMAREISTNGVGPASQYSRPHPSLIAMFASFAAAGVTVDSDIRIAGNVKVSIRSRLLEHFPSEAIAHFERPRDQEESPPSRMRPSS